MWKIMNGCECCTNVCNPQDNDTDYDMGIIVSVPGERVPRKRYPLTRSKKGFAHHNPDDGKTGEDRRGPEERSIKMFP